MDGLPKTATGKIQRFRLRDDAIGAYGRRSLETAWWGPAPDAAPTLVLLHEGLGCVALWRDFPERAGRGDRLRRVRLFALRLWRSDPVPLPRPMTLHA